MSKSAKILCVIFAVVIAAGLAYGIASYEPMFTAEAADLAVTGLKVNYLTDPLGIAPEVRPTFSWKSETDRTGMNQTAYRIEVATKDTFNSGSVYWDSGKVKGDTSVCIPYTGRLLKAETKYYWRVTVWDENGEHKASAPACFETAASSKVMGNVAFISNTPAGGAFENYTISFDMCINQMALGVMLDYRNDSEYLLWQFNVADKGVLYLRKHFFKGGQFTIDEVNAQAKLSEDIGFYDWFTVRFEVTPEKIVTYINDVLIDSTKHAQPTFGAFGFRQANPGSGVNEIGTVDNVQITLVRKGRETVNRTINFDDGTSPYAIGVVEDGKLKAYSEVGVAVGVQSLTGEEVKTVDGAVVFRKAFEAKAKNVAKARLYVSALGNFNVFLNGTELGEDELKPGWTDYNERLAFYTIDVTENVAAGGNVLSAWVTDGWWSGSIARGTYSSNDVAFLARLVIEYADGKQQIIETDESWYWTDKCPVTYASIYGGEDYDARISATLAETGEYDQSSWVQAYLYTTYTGEITPADGAFIKELKELERVPESTVIYQGTKSNKTEYGEINVISSLGDESFTLKAGQTAVIDFGQNIVGRPEITVSGAAGAKITIDFGEMLNDTGKASRGNDGPAGSVYSANYRSARSQNNYILSGSGTETYHAEYTFFGFRYISITVSDTVTFEKVRGQVLSSDTESTGFIETSDASVNQLISNISWGQRGNYLSVPTDCPQRDERLGWTGDTQVFAGTGTYNSDMAAFFRKWLQDAIDSQADNGAYTDVIPESTATANGAAAWADAGIIVPYVMYRKYGDTWLIRRNYSSMEKYIQFIIANGGPLERYGDWLAYEATEQRIIVRAYYAYDLLLMSRMSEAIGENAKAEYYRSLYEDVKADYIDDYIISGYGMMRDTQTACIVTLMADLVPDEETRKFVTEQLSDNIKFSGGRLQTGFVGTANIVNVLSANGDDRTAYTLLLCRENPSWLYSVDQGATTMWERWNSYTLSSGFGDVGMNSFNHYAYGCVGQWMYTYMAGINGDNSVAFKDFELAPRIDPDNRITYVNASFESMYGQIRSCWDTSDGQTFKYEFTVPANTSATVTLPGMLLDSGFTKIQLETETQVSYNLSELTPGTELCPGVIYQGNTDGPIVLSCVSGSYKLVLS